MGIRIFIFIFLLFSKLVHATQCDISHNASLKVDAISDLSQVVNSFARLSVCESFNQTDTYYELKEKLGTIVANQTNKVLHIKDRHQMGDALNTCEPTKESKAFVISFAGTGAFNPRTHALLAQIIKCESFQNLSTQLKKRAYGFFYNEFKIKNSAFTNWSGIDKGIMSKFISDTKLNHQAKNFDFAIFASEESEIIASPQNINIHSLSNIANEIAASTQSQPRGIIDAKKCLIKYSTKSKELGIHPKLIVLSHSSGGRSAVKFLELMKENKIKADLVLSIDPVIEAHHAIEEVADQLAGRAIKYISPFASKAKPVRIWSRKYPDRLYKTNAKEWINFYQVDDSKGIGMKPEFGIYGSPIMGADNYKIENTGASGHGKICYMDEVLNKMKENILELFE